MVNLFVCKNVVFLSKDQDNYREFVNKFLVKYESVTKVDYMNSTKYKKRFKTVKERRDLYNEDTNFITFSRGILELVPPSEYVARYHEDSDSLIVPNLEYHEIMKTLDVFDLREDQVVAVRKCLQIGRAHV